MRIIVVDDREEERYLAETLLKGSGYEVETATNGIEALEKLRAEGFDMIVSDVLMPVMDGFRLCQECREDEKLNDIPFVFYTATYKDERDEELASAVGADKYIRKPVEPEEFIKIIQGIFRDVEEGKISPKKGVLEEEEEVFKLYNERLITKLEKKLLELEAEVAQRKRAEATTEHLSQVLRSIRSVNQLIVKEKDRDRLLKEACNNLTWTRSLPHAWIVLLDGAGRLVAYAETGLGKEFIRVVEQLKRGELTACGRKALKQSDVVVTKDPPSACGGCPLAKNCVGRGAITLRLEHGKKVYGLLAVSVPTEFIEDEEGQSLLQEVAGDVAFALHNMELEEENRQAEEALQRSEKYHRTIIQTALDGFWVNDMEGRILDVNNSYCQMMGYSREEFVGGMSIPDVETMEEPGETAKHIKQILKRRSDRFETQHRRKDGEIIDLEISATYNEDEGQIVAFIRDITARKKAEARVRKSLEGAVQAIGRTTETRDPYTAGHQRRVTRLSCAIAEEMGLPKEQVEGIRVAGLTHDIGKMSIPAEILSKPSKLSGVEYNLIKTHPQVAYDILNTIEFPWPIAEIVLQHHERMDGSGYPKGLKGDEILLEARIIAVADVVEAMASHRPYRAALGLDKALEEIAGNKGVKYDPQAADVCLKLFAKKRFSFDD
jgi:PAS domain S-box-containing protein/putative nucleotidyltransferase with HDIG domain